MALTNILLAAILLILIKQYYPEQFRQVLTVAIAVAAIYGIYWLIARAPHLWRTRRAERLQEEQDEKEYWEYHTKTEELRFKYDPNKEWNEATNVPNDYLRDLRELNLQHQAMLMRRNGWTDADFTE